MNSYSRLMNRTISNHFKTLQSERCEMRIEINTFLRLMIRGISRYFGTVSKEVTNGR
jgi:hypothetical protein